MKIRDISPNRSFILARNALGNSEVPMYCSIHGLSLEFFCFDDKQRICSECVRTQHKTHKFNFVNVCASINKELLDYLRSRSS